MQRQPIVTVPLLSAVLLSLLAAGAAAGQSDGVAGPGQAAPWSVEGSPNPPRRPDTGGREGDREREEFRERLAKLGKEPGLHCQILEIEELGRIYVQESPSASPYWIQLPPEVKIRTTHRKSFDGRKKLTLADLEVGQHLVVLLKDNTDEIVKVMVRPAKV